jgi:hypothetical protein
MEHISVDIYSDYFFERFDIFFEDTTEGREVRPSFSG